MIKYIIITFFIAFFVGYFTDYYLTKNDLKHFCDRGQGIYASKFEFQIKCR